MELSGLTDIHTHGFGSCDTRTSRPEQILRMARLHEQAGTAAILTALYPAPLKEMRAALRAVQEAMEIQQSFSVSRKPSGTVHRGARILGVHLEGPFLNPLRCGALDKRFFLRPTTASLWKLTEGFEKVIRIITIAPELPGALQLIETCREQGILVNMGHSEATYQEASEGKQAGATGITHLFNAMRPFHHREPGIAGFALLDRDLPVEIIADGVHLHPDTLRLIFSLKPSGKIIMVSDSVRGAGRSGCPPRTTQGVLAGGGTSLAHACRLLQRIGIPASSVKKAAVYAPLRYLGLRP